MVLYVFAIAVLNLLLGFAVATHLGRRHRLLVAEEESRTPGPGAETALGRAAPDGGDPAAADDSDTGSPPAGDQPGLDDDDPAREADEVPGRILERMEVEQRLDHWWDAEAGRTRPLSVAVCDVDRFAQVNGAHGHDVGDMVLSALQRLLVEQSGDDAVLGRFSGQRFCSMFPDADARSAARRVEQVRQAVELCRMQYQEQTIRITLRCAVTEATADDTAATLIARAEAATQEARRHGGNCTVLDDGEQAVLVPPCECSLQEQEITL